MTTYTLKIAILDDDFNRIEEMKRCLVARLPKFEVVSFDNAPDMIEWLEKYLNELQLICLDHDLGPNRQRAGEVFDPGTGRDVADYLASRIPTCPILIHTTNSLAAPGMEMVLADSGWQHLRVGPYDDLAWIGQAWITDVMSVLFA